MRVVVVVSGSGTTGVGGLEGKLVLIFGSGEGETIVGHLIGTVVVVVRSSGATVVVVSFGTVSCSTVVSLSEGTIFDK